MGMLIHGTWTDVDRRTRNGAYVRETSVFDQPITTKLLQQILRDPARFCLIASWSCPWSHRVLLVRAVKGLNETLPVHMAGGPRRQGYALNGGHPWTPPGVNQSLIHLHELYSLSEPNYSGRATVPLLWDAKHRRIISNDSAAIMAALDQLPFDQPPRHRLAPPHLREAMGRMQRRIYTGLSNGVYRARFAESDRARRLAIDDVANTLQYLAQHLNRHRFLLGPRPTLVDWMLFPTLVRFEVVYGHEHPCATISLDDYPAVSAYARDLYAQPHVADTIDFTRLRAAETADEAPPAAVDGHRLHQQWSQPHNREHLTHAFTQAVPS